MKKLVSIELEEFESGAWIADAVSLEQFDGSFEMAGETWTGTTVSERFEFELWHTRIIGGSFKLAETIQDKYYDGSVSVQAAVQDVCRACGETFGSATTGKFLSTFERIRGPAYAALDSIASAFGLMWWIGRDGNVAMLAERPDGGEATGRRVSSDVDSAFIKDPEDLTLGATYDDNPVRHIRWRLASGQLDATVYFVPFLFRPPTRNEYDALRDAKVDKDNGDGTIDVIVSGRFGVTKVKLFCGVPHSKVKVDPGDLVTLGFFGSDPQKPFAVAMAQDTSATKEVARKGDKAGSGTLVVVHVPASGVGVTPCTLSLTYTHGDGTGVTSLPAGSGSITVKEKITEGSERLKVGD